MRLLVFTQAVDRQDSILGFFHRWIEEFAAHCEHVYVVCLREGAHDLPKNVTVLSLGKEKGNGRFTYLRLFFSYVWKYRHEYDAVFVHMNQIYAILGGLLWWVWGKHTALWYAHGATSFSLRVATFFTHRVVTSTPEGFRLKSKKKRVVGQGIDTALFPRCADTFQNEHIRIVCVGRVSKIKRCEVLVEALSLLRARGEDASVTFVGDTSDTSYIAELNTQAEEKGVVAAMAFAGAVPHNEVARYICEADVFANPSATGSLDKVGLEALVAGVLVVTSNPAFREILGDYAPRLMFPQDDAGALADRLLALHRAADRREIIDTLAAAVKKEHSVEALIPRILSALSSIT